ncbi:ParB N-terminal domain-containing protein [Thalassoroseus pseudoceratinae]|uniref:ParB N-terminal domain-containing protein n=1 Tax=Thalassoroseus pseudoceratinae TaxID=2713176 RepID=UPI00141EB640|nr:ParB N-terminal domain-containing protein [Thalassoroseus pseudoceratinae]
MQLRTLPITDLKPAPYNPRVELKPGMPGYERLARSLDEFELVQPVVWNEQTGHVVGGHQRLSVLRDRGVTEVPAVVVSLSLEREKALNIALNNANVGGDWDPTKLVELLSDLDGQEDFDATLTGFDAEELKNLVLAPDPNFAPETSEDTPETEPIVQVTFEIPEADWPDHRERFDSLIAELDLKVHVRLPS